MKETLHFNLDAPQLLEEITNNENIGILKIPLNVLRMKLANVAGIAIELDDPKLNIAMLEMKLYEVEHTEIHGLIEQQKKRL